MGIRSLRVRSARSGGGGSGCGVTTAGDEFKEPADPETPSPLIILLRSTTLRAGLLKGIYRGSIRE